MARKLGAVSSRDSSTATMAPVLILGGTSEARQLAARLAGRGDLAPLLSLAGRTAAPLAQPIPVRVGGFGGVDGLATYLRASATVALIDATHPYAANISHNAVAAAAAAAVNTARRVKLAISVSSTISRSA